MKVRTTYLFAATKYAIYCAMSLVLLVYMATRPDIPTYITAALVIFTLFLGWMAFRDWRTYQAIPAEDTREVGAQLAESTQAPGGARYGWLYIAIGIAALVAGWPRGDRFYPVGLFAGPILILLGAGGAIDKRILVGLRNDRPEVTPAIRRAAYGILIAGFALGGLLVFLVRSGRI